MADLLKFRDKFATLRLFDRRAAAATSSSSLLRASHVGDPLFKKTKGTPDRLRTQMAGSSGSMLSISISFEKGIPMANSDLTC